MNLIIKFVKAELLAFHFLREPKHSLLRHHPLVRLSMVLSLKIVKNPSRKQFKSEAGCIQSGIETDRHIAEGPTFLTKGFEPRTLRAAHNTD